MAISVRNNNPGALMYASWEKAYGAVPGGKNVAGTLARFPTPAQGYAAAAQWHRRAEAKGMVTLNQRMRVLAANMVAMSGTPIPVREGNPGQ